MEGNKEEAILALDYDDDDSSDEEEDEELFDNSKVDWRVKGILLRGKEFSVSDNGNCPRCQSNVIVFVILDELFPMGDMPEILYNLLAKGKGVLWSSQDKQSCKKAPTFMCRGFCPPDPLGAGFNINWDTVNLTKLLKDLLKLNIAKAQKKLQESGKANENEGEDDDVNEKDIIKAMLAQEQEKEEKPVHGPLKENETPKETPSSETASTTHAESSTTPVTSSTTKSSASTPATYPVSKDGSCPHCGSTVVRYIILIKDSTKDITLPPTLERLLQMGKAFKMAKGANSPPSFQCCACTYGFNLDWSKTDLKKIFNLETETTSSSASTTASTTKATKTTTMATTSIATVSSTTYKSYTSYPATSYQTSSYGSYAYTQPPMGYPGPYGYPAPAPLMAQPPPPMGGMAPPPYGAPMPYAGAQPYLGMPPQPFGATPPPGAFMGPPRPYPGVPPNQFGPIPLGNVPPRGAPMFGMQPNMPANFHGNLGGNIPGTMAGNIPGVMSANVSSPGVMAGPGPLPGLMQGPGGPAPIPGPGPMQVPGTIPMPGSMPGPVPMAVHGPIQGPGPIPIPNRMQGPVPGLGPFPGNPQGPGNFPGNVPGPVNMQGMPRLRVPKGPQKGQNKNWKGKWKGQQGPNDNHENLAVQEQWPQVDGESHENDDDEEGTSEDVYDPDAATRFEELLNKIDDHEHEVDNEDEKPPGEETQAEFEVSAFTPEEKPAVEKNIEKNDPESIVEKTQADSVEKNIEKNEPESIVEKTQANSVENIVTKEPKSICEKSQENSESVVTEKSEPMEQDVTVKNTNFSEATIKPEPTCDSDLANVSESNDEANVTSQAESDGLQASPAPRAKASRGRKRQATGARKKTSARNTRVKKAVENTVEPEDGIGKNNGTDGLTETGDEIKRVKVESEQDSTGTDESIKGETAEDIVPKRVTRARSLRQKK